MRLLDTTFETPAENLAFDETPLLASDHGQSSDTLRFWESPVSFVVLGTGQRLDEEVHELHCKEDGIQILRRCTAGGCVVQGPGCLNFTITANTEANVWARNLHESYCHILNSIARELQKLGYEVQHKGVSDLAWGEGKVSGNAQRRKRGAILHHGTLLYGKPDHGAMERYLKEPSSRPDYRGERQHRQFVKALPMSKRELQDAVMDAFSVEGEFAAPACWELEQMQTLVREKYTAEEWTRRRLAVR